MLLLADGSQGHAATLVEHIASLVNLSHHDVRTLNPRGVESLRTLRLEQFDVVVIHYSLMVLSDHYLSPWFRDRIAAYDGLKVQFIQDDYRQVGEMRQAMRELGIRLLFTLVPERELERVWPTSELPGVTKVTTLAGYVPAAAARFRTPALPSRPLDVGYRGRALPPWLGILGQEKAWIAEGFLARARKRGLRCDIGWTENARIYGEDWFRFVASCRVTLGTESGTTITDFDGSIERDSRAYMAENPDATFWEVHEAVLAPFEGNVQMNVISPRLFEAASLRTGLVLFPGEYSGILEPGRHYVPLEKDFSNVDDVVATIRNTSALAEMIERSYEEIVASGRFSYNRMVAEFDRLLEELAEPEQRRRSAGRDWSRSEERALRAAARPKGALGALARLVAGARLVSADPATLRLIGRYASSSKLRRSVRRDALWYDLVRLAMIRRANLGRLRAGPDFVVEEERGEATRVFVSRPVEPTSATSGDGLVRAAPVDANANLIWRHSMIGETFAAPLTPFRWVFLPVVPTGGTPIYEFLTLQTLRVHVPLLVDKAIADLETTERERRTTPAPAPRVPIGLGVIRHPVLYARKARMALRIIRRNDALRGALLHVLGTPRLRRVASLRSLAADLVFVDLLRRADHGELRGIVRIEAELLANRTLMFRSRGDERSGPVTSLAESLAAGADIGCLVWDNGEAGTVIEIVDHRARIPFGFPPDRKRTFWALSALLECDPAFVLRTIASCLGPPDASHRSDREPTS